jgi:hypothetical protein
MRNRRLVLHLNDIERDNLLRLSLGRPLARVVRERALRSDLNAIEHVSRELTAANFERDVQGLVDHYRRGGVDRRTLIGVLDLAKGVVSDG